MATNAHYQHLILKKKKKTTHKTNYANNWNRNRITEMEITWKVIIREGEGG